MLFIIRHSEDSPETTHRYDNRLTENGRKMARRKGERLVDKYGIPSVIYCSPFRRTKETVEEMLKMIPEKYHKKIKIVYTKELGRFFSSQERKNPDIAKSTKKSGVPTNENGTEFRQRVSNFAQFLLEHHKDDVWIVTHSTVYKQLARNFLATIPEYIEPVGHFKIKVHS